MEQKMGQLSGINKSLIEVWKSQSYFYTKEKNVLR
jgi:hypothetical protein